MADQSSEFLAFRRCHAIVLQGIKYSLEPIVDKAYGLELIQNSFKNECQNKTTPPEERTRQFLEDMQYRIQIKPETFHTFVKILKEEPADYVGDKLLEELEEAKKKQTARVQQVASGSSASSSFSKQARVRSVTPPPTPSKDFVPDFRTRRKSDTHTPGPLQEPDKEPQSLAEPTTVSTKPEKILRSESEDSTYYTPMNSLRSEELKNSSIPDCQNCANFRRHLFNSEGKIKSLESELEDCEGTDDAQMSSLKEELYQKEQEYITQGSDTCMATYASRLEKRIIELEETMQLDEHRYRAQVQVWKDTVQTLTSQQFSLCYQMPQVIESSQMHTARPQCPPYPTDSSPYYHQQPHPPQRQETGPSQFQPPPYTPATGPQNPPFSPARSPHYQQPQPPQSQETRPPPYQQSHLPQQPLPYPLHDQLPHPPLYHTTPNITPLPMPMPGKQWAATLLGGEQAPLEVMHREEIEIRE